MTRLILEQEVEVSRQLISNVLPRYAVDVRASILRWWDRLANPVLVEGPYVTNRAARRHPPRAPRGRRRH